MKKITSFRTTVAAGNCPKGTAVLFVLYSDFTEERGFIAESEANRIDEAFAKGEYDNVKSLINVLMAECRGYI